MTRTGSEPGGEVLHLGPRRPRARPRPRHGLRRRLARAVLAGLATSLLLLVLVVATSHGWRPPPELAPLDVAPVPVVDPGDRHLPYAFVDRAETVVADGSRARVVRPRGAEGTLPGIVLVGEAGAASDDLADAAEALARGGLVVLTYDERPPGLLVRGRDDERRAADALGALDAVALRPAVDPDRLGLLGFGDGGRVVTLAAARSPYRVPLAGRPPAAQVAFTVLLSAPVVTPLERASWVLDRRLVRAPVTVRAAAAALLERGRLLLGDAGTDLPADPRASLPCYAVWGAADPTVPVRVAVDRFRAGTRGRDPVEVVGGAGHRVALASGWAERASDWVRRGFPEDPLVRGAQPAAPVGLPVLPRQDLPGDVRLDLGLVAFAALVAGAGPLRGERSRRTVSTSRSG